MKDFEGKAHYPIDLESLPKAWACAFVGEICDDVQSGFASGEHNSRGSGVPHLRPMNIDRLGHVDMAVVKSVAATTDKRRLRRGDVLFNNTNSPVLVGKTAPICRDDDVAFSNHMTRLRPHAGIDYEFLAYELHYLWMGGYFLHRCSKHVNQASVSAETLASSVPAVVPPTAEQRRIVEAIDSCLTRLDDAVASLERAQAKLKAYRASVLKAAVEGRLVPTEASLARAEKRDYEPADVLLARILKERRRRWEEAELARLKAAGKTPTDDKWQAKYEEPLAPETTALPPLPEGWCWAAWQQVGYSQNGRAFPSAEYRDTGVRLLRPGNLHESGRVEWNEKNTRHMPEKWAADYPGHLVGPDELVINLTAQSLADEFLGRVCLTSSGEHCLLNQRIARLTPVLLPPRFLLCVFKSPWFRKFVASLNTGSLIQHMFTTQLKDFVLPLPPLAEQERIAAEVERQSTLSEFSATSAVVSMRRAHSLRQALLKWAFEGKLVDQDVSDEPAEKLLARIREERAAAIPAKKANGRRGGAA